MVGHDVNIKASNCNCVLPLLMNKSCVIIVYFNGIFDTITYGRKKEFGSYCNDFPNARTGEC